jgi:hypothetical protein
VFSTASNSAYITSVFFKMATFLFYLQSRKQRKVGWMWDDSHVVMSKKFSGEGGSVRKGCVVVKQQPVPLSPKFEAKFSDIFKQSPQ